MRQDFDRFQAANVDVVAITMGSSQRSREFKAAYHLPFTLLGDPRRRAYAAYGLLRMDLRRETNLSGAVRVAQAVLKHGGGLEFEQDMRQLGGVFLVDTAGTIRYAFRSLRASEWPSNDELFGAAVQLDEPADSRPSPGA